MEPPVEMSDLESVMSGGPEMHRKEAEKRQSRERTEELLYTLTGKHPPGSGPKWLWQLQRGELPRVRSGGKRKRTKKRRRRKTRKQRKRARPRAKTRRRRGRSRRR